MRHVRRNTVSFSVPGMCVRVAVCRICCSACSEVRPPALGKMAASLMRIGVRGARQVLMEQLGLQAATLSIKAAGPPKKKKVKGAEAGEESSRDSHIQAAECPKLRFQLINSEPEFLEQPTLATDVFTRNHNGVHQLPQHAESVEKPIEPVEEILDTSTYKNTQHHDYTPLTFIDLDMEMANYRLPQPSSGRMTARH
ncbi:uncharacterized protein ndufv3 [Heterodontus francisci]|uniref:uncharacterized protein ndufv3 n=1 Tax=Heterodontus francisci TaxID=7792 RepID=UPI00355C4C4D